MGLGPCAVCSIGAELVLSWGLCRVRIVHPLCSFVHAVHVMTFPLCCHAYCQVFWQRPMKSNALGELMEELKLLFVGRYLRNGFKIPVLWNSGTVFVHLHICYNGRCFFAPFSDGPACLKLQIHPRLDFRILFSSMITYLQ